jgi:hypothetical protein
MAARIRMFKNLPPRKVGGNTPNVSKYARFFEAAERNPGKYVEISNTNLLQMFGTAKNRGLRAVQRSGRVFVFKPARRGAK